jgi:hypothetical protein
VYGLDVDPKNNVPDWREGMLYVIYDEPSRTDVLVVKDLTFSNGYYTYTVSGAGADAKDGVPFIGWISSADERLYAPNAQMVLSEETLKQLMESGGVITMTAQWSGDNGDSGGNGGNGGDSGDGGDGGDGYTPPPSNTEDKDKGKEDGKDDGKDANTNPGTDTGGSNGSNESNGSGESGGSGGSGSSVPPGTPVQPGRPDVPPVPYTPGGSLIPLDDGGFLEIDEDGVPLGTWEYDDDEGAWIFDESVPLALLPQTGGILPSSDASYLWAFPLLALLGLALAWLRLRRYIRARMR